MKRTWVDVRVKYNTPKDRTKRVVTVYRPQELPIDRGVLHVVQLKPRGHVGKPLEFVARMDKYGNLYAGIASPLPKGWPGLRRTKRGQYKSAVANDVDYRAAITVLG